MITKAFSVITSRDNISWRGTKGLQHHDFLIFDGKRHPKNIWFRGC